MLEHLKENLNYGLTENGAMTHLTTYSGLLDYFAQGSSLRSRSVVDKYRLFKDAFAEDKLIAMKILFYSRDIIQGQGERKAFRDIIHMLAKEHPDVVRKNLHLIPEFGRWDDIYAVFNTPLEQDAIKLIEKQLNDDLRNAKYPSLLAKWLKSENTSSKESIRLAKKTRQGLGLNSKKYRQVLSLLRENLNIIETHLVNREYDKIEYSKIPSQAMLKYSEAFARNDEERYTAYLESLKQGKTKVNTKALAPYQMVKKVIDSFSVDENQDALLNEMWKNIPNFLKDDKSNSLAVVDVSGSMFDQYGSINMSIALGLYLAERNQGAFANHFFTFSEKPKLVEVKGDTFCEKVRNMRMADWGYNTNIKSMFNLLLKTAIKKGLSQSDMPEKIFIISDMEFDVATRSGYNETLFESIKKEYEEAGFKLPRLVFWNVASRQNNIPMLPDNEDAVQLVSGNNPNLFEALLSGEQLNEFDLMMQVLNKERYSLITV